MRNDAPKIRTAESIIAKHEQVLDALERDAISGKVAEQMGQQLKGIVRVVDLEMRYWSLVAKLGRRAPVPRSALLRNIIGLPAQVSPSDGEYVRQLVDDGKK